MSARTQNRIVHRSRKWTFTLYHTFATKEAWLADMQRIVDGSVICRYMIAQPELCPKTQRKHTQGYLECEKPIVLDTAKKVIGYNQVHMEIAYAGQSANKRYCTKKESRLFDEDCVFEWGDALKSGQRTDLEAVATMIQNGDSLTDVAQEAPGTFIRYHAGLTRFAALTRKRARAERKVIVLFGPTGTGKTETAMDYDEDAYRWTPMAGTWFDGYDNQRTIVFDEFRGQLSFAAMLFILDKYDARLQIKGGFVCHTADTIFITSPVHPVCWYPVKASSPDSLDQLKRRITQIFQTSKDGHTDVTETDWEEFRPAQEFDQYPSTY